jgi:hypothetical protein
MSAAPPSRDLRFNFDLVMAEITRWPFITIAILAAVAVAAILQPDQKLPPIEAAIALGGSLVGVLGLKGLFLLAIYPRLRKQAFPGSYLATSFIVFVPIFVFYATALLLVVPRYGDEVPLMEVTLFMIFAYLFFGIFFAGALRLFHAFAGLGRPNDSPE